MTKRKPKCRYRDDICPILENEPDYKLDPKEDCITCLCTQIELIEGDKEWAERKLNEFKETLRRHGIRIARIILALKERGSMTASEMLSLYYLPRQDRYEVEEFLLNNLPARRESRGRGFRWYWEE